MVPYSQESLDLHRKKMYVEYAHQRIRDIQEGTERPFTFAPAIEKELRSNPNDPCSKYKEVKKMAFEFKMKWGERQLELDCKTAQESLYGNNKQNN